MKFSVWLRVLGFVLASIAVVLFAFWRAAQTLPIEPIQYTQGETTVSVEAIRQTILWGLPGDCANVRWTSQNIAAIFLNDGGTVGEGEQLMCVGSDQSVRFRVEVPDADDQLLTLHIPKRQIRVLFIAAACLLIGAVVALPPVYRVFSATLRPNVTDRASEILPLTSLRAFGAFMVVLHHFQPDFRYGAFRTFSDQSYLGVAIFFTLSGFLITIRYFDTLTNPRLTWNNFIDYYVKRIARIYPLYFFIFLITFISLGASFFDGRALIYVLNVQDFYTFYRVRFLPSAWSLTVEFNFYLIAPFVFLGCAAVFRRFHRARQQIIAVIGVFTVWTLALLFLSWFLPQINPFEFGAFFDTYYSLLSWTIFGRFFEFAVGIALGLLYNAGWLKRVTANAISMTIVSLLALAGIIAVHYIIAFAKSQGWGGLEYRAHFWAGNYSIAVLTAILIASLLNSENMVARLLSFPTLVYMGHISYAVYLLHVSPIMNPVFQAADILGVLEATPLYIAIIYIGANIMSIPFYEWIEKPARTSVLNRYTRIKQNLSIEKQQTLKLSS